MVHFVWLIVSSDILYCSFDAGRENFE